MPAEHEDLVARMARADGSSNPAQLQESLQDPDPNVRLAAVSNPNTSSQQLEQYLEDGHEGYASDVANNVLVNRLMADKDLPTRALVHALLHRNPYLILDGRKLRQAKEDLLEQLEVNEKEALANLVKTDPSGLKIIEQHLLTVRDTLGTHTKVKTIQPSKKDGKGAHIAT